MLSPFLLSHPERAKQIQDQQREHLKLEKYPFFRILNYPAIAFDLDHTLARYRIPALHKLCYELVVKYLCEHGYSKEAFRPFGEIDLRFAQRGIYFDKHRGVMLKLNGKGEIAQAYYGTSRMSDEEVKDIYAGCKQLITLKYGPFVRPEGENRAEPVLHCFDDHFTTGTIYLLMELVQMCIDGKRIHYGFERPLRKIQEAYSFIFARSDFEEGRGGFFAALKKNPSEYYYRLSYEFLQWLKLLKASKMALFVITNSGADHAYHVLHYVIGENWRDYFHAVISNAKKPYFFTFIKRPFNVVDGVKDGRVADADDFKTTQFYSRGGMHHMKYIIKHINNHLSHRMIYVGDSLVSDIYGSHLTRSCGVIGVVEELEDEYDSEWGPMLGSKKEPSFWRRRIEEWSTGIISSVEDLKNIRPREDVLYSTHKIQIFLEGRLEDGPGWQTPAEL